MILDEEMENAYNEYLSAREEGDISSLNLNEEEFEYIIDRLVDEAKDDQVLDVCELAYARFPYSSTILVRLCDTLILMGSPDKALELLEPYSDIYSADSQVQILFARANIAKKRFVHARDYFYKAMEQKPDAHEVADSICALAQDCIEVENYEEAIYYFNKVSCMVKLPFEYYNDYAFCYDRLDEPQKAMDYYNKYLDFDPFNDTVWFNLGTVQARLREFDKAIESFEYSIALNGGNASSLYNLAVVYMNLQRYSEAVEIFERFVEIDPDVLGKLGLGEAYLRLERFDDAIRQFQGLPHDEAQLGTDAVKAVICCRNGEYEVFKELFRNIFERGVAWLQVVYEMLPFLQGEPWFFDFLDDLKNNKK